MDHERILYIYDYLSRCTDETKSVTIKDIQQYLANTAGIHEVSVLTIRRDIERLSGMGNDIRVHHGAHNTAYYSLLGKGFTFNEIRFIVDSISINQFLSSWQKQKLIKKFEGMCSEAEVRQLISRVALNGRGVPSLDLLENLEKVHNIISMCRKIHFDYGRYNTQRQMVYYSKRRDMIPIKVIYFDNRFYLKCEDAVTQTIRTYRIDRMQDIHAGEEIQKRPSLPQYDGVVLDMFEPDYFEFVTLRVQRFLLDDMLERFGEYASVWDDKEDTNCVVIRVKIGISQSFYRWVMRYGSNIEIQSPPQLRSAFFQYLQAVVDLYKDE